MDLEYRKENTEFFRRIYEVEKKLVCEDYVRPSVSQSVCLSVTYCQRLSCMWDFHEL